MKRRPRPESDSLRFVVELEQRIAKQILLIEQLKRSGRPIAQAKAALHRQQVMLVTLRNNAVIMQDLMSAESHEKTVRTKPACSTQDDSAAG